MKTPKTMVYFSFTIAKFAKDAKTELLKLKEH